MAKKTYDWVVKRTQRIYFLTPTVTHKSYLLLPKRDKSRQGCFKNSPEDASHMTESLAKFIAKEWADPLKMNEYEGCGWETVSLEAVHLPHLAQAKK